MSVRHGLGSDPGDDYHHSRGWSRELATLERDADRLRGSRLSPEENARLYRVLVDLMAIELGNRPAAE